MRLRRFLCLALLCAVTCCVLFSVSAFAAEGDYYNCGGHLVPSFPVEEDYEEGDWYGHILALDSEGNYYLKCEWFGPDDERKSYLSYTDETGCAYWNYILVDGQWVYRSGNEPILPPVWTNVNIYDKTGSLFLAASEYTIVKGPIGYSDFKDVITVYTDQINVQQLVIVLAAAASICVGLVFLWWGARKVTGALIKAFKKGKLRI